MSEIEWVQDTRRSLNVAACAKRRCRVVDMEQK